MQEGSILSHTCRRASGGSVVYSVTSFDSEKLRHRNVFMMEISLRLHTSSTILILALRPPRSSLWTLGTLSNGATFRHYTGDVSPVSGRRYYLLEGNLAR